jgi:class 3 adenylate cyclase/predicted ATPase/energy-coupling factor transporter ATP-binding protein EcfA2
MKCLSCQTDNPKTGRFCTQCGTALPVECPSCGRVNPPGNRFCGGCGANLLRSGPAPSGATAPGSSGSLEAAAAPATAGERRHLTVLFCDMVGSTALAKTLDPEDLNEITRTYYACCTDAIRLFDGIVANYVGDGVMALFGFPRAHEDDAERAVRAGLRIIRAIEACAPIGKHGVKARVGIATGMVVVGEQGVDALTREKSVVGETPNFAAHLQAATPPNTVIISAATRQLIGDVFTFEEVTLTNLKNATEPVAAWRVIGEKASTSRFAARGARLTGFVGREQEVALLTDRWHLATQGEGQVVLLQGEAGIGKSRIVEAFRGLIAETPHRVIHCQCSPFHTDSALYPVIAPIETAANIAPDDSPAARLDKLETLLKQSADRLEDVVPLFAALLSIPVGDRYPPPDPDPQRRRERTLSALTNQIVSFARQGTMLVILEDAHWADPTTLDFFGRVIVALESVPALLIITHRPEFKPAWMRHTHVTALSLNRLGRRHCSAMVGSVARGKTLPANVLEEIIAKTDGIPLFVEELTKTILESGLMREQNGSWQLTGPLLSLAIPATLQESLMARLDRLSSVKEVAQIGAAIGREFSFDVLAAVCAIRNVDFQDALVTLEAAELVYSRGMPPNSSYIFKHALIQDAAYETLLKSTRRQLHACIAGVLELRIAETEPEIIAHHYTNASLEQIAVGWWRKAGELAIKRSANPEAVRHLSRAAELVQAGPESRERDVTELGIRISLSGPLIATRGYVTSELDHNYARASELCDKLGEATSVFPVMYGQWVIPYVRGDITTALRNSETFLRRAEQQDDVGLLMIGHRIYGSSLVWCGDILPGHAHLDRAISMIRTPDHDHLAYEFGQHPRTAALAHQCLALQLLGHLDRAMAAGWEAISQAKRIGHFNSVAYALLFVSLLIMLRRDAEKLKQTAGELLQLANEHNAGYWRLVAQPMLGWIKAQEGEVEAGIAQMHESTMERQRQQANLWVPQTLLLEAEVLGEAKQYQRAYRLLNEAQALIEPLNQRLCEAELHRVRGVILIAEGTDPQAGAASIERAINVARGQNARFLELRATASKAELLRDRGLRDAARNLLKPLYDSFTEGFDTVDLRNARALLDELS